MIGFQRETLLCDHTRDRVYGVRIMIYHTYISITRPQPRGGQLIIDVS